jgi:hypothetical protein
VRSGLDKWTVRWTLARIWRVADSGRIIMPENIHKTQPWQSAMQNRKCKMHLKPPPCLFELYLPHMADGANLTKQETNQNPPRFEGRTQKQTTAYEILSSH